MTTAQPFDMARFMEEFLEFEVREGLDALFKRDSIKNLREVMEKVLAESRSPAAMIGVEKRH